MSTGKLTSLAAVAELIPDQAVVSVSSSSGLGCPDATLKAIGERFKASGAPRDITTIHPIAAGDMYGIAGIDHLARKGLLKRVIAGSYPSGPSSMESPRIWQMINSNEVEAYNLPSGIIFHMHREAAAKRPRHPDQGRLGYCRRSRASWRKNEQRHHRRPRSARGFRR